MKIEIIICTEKGYLEAQSKLLIYSIRNFGGPLKDADIFSYNPRLAGTLDQSTLEFFDTHQVVNIDLELNKKYKKYALANKPIVCAHRESISHADILIFLDTDTFFLKGPEFINSIKQNQLFMRPVTGANIGRPISSLQNDNEYWKKLYDALDVNGYTTINTVLHNEQILEYYNSGFIVSSISSGLFQNWNNNFEKAMRMNIRPKRNFYLEQSVLSATISAMNIRVNILPKELNVPINDVGRNKNPTFQIEQISHVGHFHYHRFFRRAGGKNPFYNQYNEFEAGRIINEKLIEYKVLQ